MTPAAQPRPVKLYNLICEATDQSEESHTHRKAHHHCLCLPFFAHCFWHLFQVTSRLLLSKKAIQGAFIFAEYLSYTFTQNNFEPYKLS